MSYQIPKVKKQYDGASLVGGSETAENEIGYGESYSIAPTITNQGSANAYAFIQITVPTINGRNAYTVIGSNWTELTAPDDGLIVFGTGPLSPGQSATMNATMTLDVSFAEFCELDTVSADIDGSTLAVTEDASLQSLFEENKT